ncbi:MAG: energy-coupling factor ABC transporter substrate-binding protein [Candidatus Methanomethylophilaceae archaeon]|nr:energy-coupling factor ABC transporter substrate-binding protein [Candidatus Methanomethylophilaceae archaeon]
MALTKNQKIYIVGFLLIAVLVICTLAFVSGDFGGSDDSGGQAAEKWGYIPWTGNWMEDIGFELPSETESLLFAVQAAIGAIIIGFFIGWLYARKQ